MENIIPAIPNALNPGEWFFMCLLAVTEKRHRHSLRKRNLWVAGLALSTVVWLVYMLCARTQNTRHVGQGWDTNPSVLDTCLVAVTKYFSRINIKEYRGYCYWQLSTWYSWEERTSTEKVLRLDWPGLHLWEGPAHCGHCRPYAGAVLKSN